MSKKIDLSKSVFELTREYPELIEIMKNLGFTEITNTAMLHSVGKLTTIPKGAKMKGISMMDVISALYQNGFEPTGAMPDLSKMGGNSSEASGAPAASEQTSEASEDVGTVDALKGYLRRLSQGEDLEVVRAEFVEQFSEVDASEIMKAEQELIKEGAPITEVQKLCDVHSALFHGATREEQIANAEKAVEDSLRKEAQKKKMAQTKDQKQEIAGALRGKEGHPIHTFSRENTCLTELIEKIRQGLENTGDVTKDDLAKLREISIHYAKKGDLLYPLLKVRYGVTGPSDVMWSVDDEIRDELSALAKKEEHDDTWINDFQQVVTRAEEMIYKEENILFPICAVNFTEEEWYGIYQDAKDYASVFGVTSHWPEAETVLAQKADQAKQQMLEGEVVMPGGHMTVAQLTALLNTLPIEITFVDDQNINRYFNEGPKVFKRPQMALDREVFTCHPPKIEPMVRSIIDDFRNGKRDEVPVWMEKNGVPFLVKYMAVRDRKGTYVGTVEVVQDMTFAKEHFSK